MVHLEIPGSYTFSPTDSTPHLTINHTVAEGLDSTNAFEGPEKLLEVWFAPSPNNLPHGTKPNGLKAVPAVTWEPMLDMVNCKILSVLESDGVDSYLLSESSMFVFPHKIILKTCGTTTLLLGLQRLLHIAATDAGFPFHNAKSADEIHAAATPYRFFYSRKNFLFPDKQRGPHRSWKQEVKYLDDMLEGGSAYMVGKMNGDHWYLYLTAPTSTLTPPRTPDGGSPIGHGRIPAGDIIRYPGIADDANDETLEILMTDLDVENAKQFYLSNASAVAKDELALQSVSNQCDDKEGVFELDVDQDTTEACLPEALTTEGHALGTVVSENCGLSSVYPKAVYPDARIDAYMFSPCGFSANGIVPAPVVTSEEGEDSQKAAHYFTVHVTPEPNCSFASFETNLPGGQKGRTTADVIQQVVGIFKPGRFTVTLFETKKTSFRKAATQRLEPVKGYRRTERIVHEFEDYDLVFRSYERYGWLGSGILQIGEEDSE